MARNHRTLPYPFQFTQYNGEQIPGERNDCAVRALMTVTGATYTEAHTLLREDCGRRNRRGVLTHLWQRRMDRGEVLGAKLERVRGIKRGQEVTLGRFIRENPVGTFLLGKSGHAMAVVDGTLVDTWKVGPRCRINMAWRVTRPEQVQVETPKVETKVRKPAKVSSSHTDKFQAMVELGEVQVDGTILVLPSHMEQAGWSPVYRKPGKGWSAKYPGGKAAAALGYSVKATSRGPQGFRLILTKVD